MEQLSYPESDRRIIFPEYEDPPEIPYQGKISDRYIPLENVSGEDPWYVSLGKKAWTFVKHVATVPEDKSCELCCSDLELNCFDLSRYVFFILGTVLVPYFIYQAVSNKNKWTEKRVKTRAEHFETLVTAVTYMTMLYMFGNYKNTYDWVTFLATTVSILGYSYIAELPFAHESLTTVSNWNKKMWTLIIFAISLVIAFAGYHIYLAVQVGGSGFWKTYVGSLIIPVVLGYLSYKTVQDQNSDPSEKKMVTLHVHHIHIFYVLAFFTRFSTLLSRIAAGVVIGASLQGAAAYGFDTTFEHKLKPLPRPVPKPVVDPNLVISR